MTSLDYDAIRALCHKDAGFDAATAYARTLVCCKVLTERGEAIPGWEVIRRIIDKGSSTDITRGVADYRRDLAAKLAKLSGLVPGLPERLADSIRNLWEQALAEAERRYAPRVAEWEQQVQQAQAQADQAVEEAAEAKALAERLRSQLAGEEVAQQALRQQIATERAAKEQAERMFNAQAADLTAQRERMEAALSEAKTELQGAVSRLQGVERQALMRVEEVRGEAAKTLAATQDRAAREKSALEMQIARLTSTVNDLQNKWTTEQQRAAVARQESHDLRARLARAEAQVDKLSTENAKMASLAQARGGVQAGRRGAPAAKRVRPLKKSKERK